MSIVGQFFLAVAFAVAAIFLGLAVHEGFAALGCISGLLLVGMSIRGLTNDRDWERFLAAQRGQGYPSGHAWRLAFAVVTFVIGAAWTVAGVVGGLAAMGVLEFPEQ